MTRRPAQRLSIAWRRSRFSRSSARLCASARAQTTTPARPNDWSTDSLTLLREYLASLTEDGTRLGVVARNREVAPGTPDPQLSRLDESDFDELWLFALDSGDGITAEECEGITRFRERGGGILTTRDHQDIGSSLCTLGGVGLAHFFGEEPRARRRASRAG